MSERVLRFRLKTDDPFGVYKRFYVDGRQVLNRSEWYGKEPRSCAVTGVRGGLQEGQTEYVFNVEVTYRPKGCITYVGSTRYDGWTAMLPGSAGQGDVPCEVFGDADFSQIDFGEFVGESDVPGIERVQLEDAGRVISGSGRFGTSIRSTFVAQRRHRPLVRILITDGTKGITSGGIGERVISVDRSASDFQESLTNHFSESLAGFIEGRYSLLAFSSDAHTLIDFGKVVYESREPPALRNVDLLSLVPDGFLEDLCKRLKAMYTIDVKIVEGERAGLLLSHEPAPA